jgi:hypothetical protein
VRLSIVAVYVWAVLLFVVVIMVGTDVCFGFGLACLTLETFVADLVGITFTVGYYFAVGASSEMSLSKNEFS